jgi:hypothetical protein
MRAELFSGPLCQLDEAKGIVRVTMSFTVYECDGRLLELAWEDTLPQESGKLLGGTCRVLAREEAAPAGFELRLPLALFLAPRRIDFRLRMMEPLRSLGRGHAFPQADAAGLPGSVRLELSTWVDLG